MAYAEHLYVAGETVTASNLNQSTYYNCRYLKGKDGAIVVEDAITRAAPLSSSFVIAAWIAGDTQHRWNVEGSGCMRWGPGNAAPDVTLYRDAANVLKTDDDLVVVDMRVHRHPYAGRRHIESGSVAVAHASYTDISFTNAYASAPVVVAIGDRQYSSFYIDNITGSGARINNGHATDDAIAYWIAEGPD